MTASRILFTEFINVNTPEAQSALLDKIVSTGYTHLRYLVDEMKDAIRRAEDEDFPLLTKWIAQARQMIPDPSQISPYYQAVWDQLAKILAYKQEAFHQIAKDQRQGEWQIVYNNPNTNDDLLCIPSLSFAEAAYLYAKYRLDLKKAEILRLQKVVEHLTIAGDLA